MSLSPLPPFPHSLSSLPNCDSLKYLMMAKSTLFCKQFDGYQTQINLSGYKSLHTCFMQQIM